MKPFIGFDKYQIGLPPAGYAQLFINLCELEGVSATEAIAKTEAMGYEPQLRYLDTPDGLEVCILLKTVKLEDPFGENTLGDRWENLAEIFGNAVRCPIGRPPQKLSQLHDRFSLASAAKTH